MLKKQISLTLMTLAASAALIIAVLVLIYEPKGGSQEDAAQREEAAAAPVEASPAPTTAQAEPPPESAMDASELRTGETIARQAILDKIESVPEIGRFFAHLQTLMPRDYEIALATLATSEIALNPDSVNPDALLSQTVKIVRQRHKSASAQADGPMLAKIFDRQLAILELLEPKAASICLDFMNGGANPAFFQIAAENRRVISDLAIAGLDAIVDGEMRRIKRAPPNEADFQLLEKSLQDNGLGSPEISALLDGVAPDPPISDQRMCAAGVTYLKTLAQLPEEPRLRIYSLALELMSNN